jgi:photosystem II stability/assembly factor-like uncharacterized protein
MMIVCLSPNGRVESRGAGPAHTVLVGSLRGVHALRREGTGELWKCEPRGLQDKHISSLLWEPQSNLLFAGIHGRAEAGGLFVSADIGYTWEPRMAGLDRTHVYTLAAEQRGERTILYAGVEPAALYRSTDLGLSWHDLSALREVPGTDKWIFPPPPHIAHVKNVAFHPKEPGVLYALVEQGALLKSTDDGASWREIESYSSGTDSFYRDVHRLAIASSNPKQLHLATGDGLYFSDDGGETWAHQQRRTDRVGYPDALFVNPTDDSTVYLGGAGDAPETWRKDGGAFPGFIVSHDCGKTWAELMDGITQPIHGNIEGMAMHSWPGGLEFFAGTAVGAVFSTEDGGAHWTLAAEGLPPISKARHYRHFLSADEKARIESEAKAERRAEGLADRTYNTNP